LSEVSDPRAESVADHFGIALVIAHGARLDCLPQVGVETHGSDLAWAVSGGPPTSFAELLNGVAMFRLGSNTFDVRLGDLLAVDLVSHEQYRNTNCRDSHRLQIRRLGVRPNPAIPTDCRLARSSLVEVGVVEIPVSTIRWLSARNDSLANVAIIVAAVVVLVTGTGWPDIVVVLGIGLLNADVARVVWRAARAERLDASAADA